MTEEGIRVRFAPSPTGKLHLGNARTALFNWLLARSRGGRFILRIEDTDVERNAEGAEAGILRDLRWLGLGWDEGPDCGGPYGPYRQSERESAHGRAVERMMAAGDAYRCFCSPERLDADREAQRRAGLPPRYAGRCRAVSPDESARRAAASEPFAVRLEVPDEGVSFVDMVRGQVTFPAEQLGDPVLVRRDGRPAYNFAVVVDDLGMNVTHVVRGEDHISNTPLQILIYRALGGTPPSFAHLSMVLGEGGGRLSKREGALSVARFRDEGFLPEALANYLALLGWSHPEGKDVMGTDELVASFSLDRVSKSAAAYDPAKLLYINARHLRALPAGRLLAAATPFLQRAGLTPPREAGGPAGSWWAGALELVRGQMDLLAGAPDAMKIFFDPPAPEGSPARPEEAAAEVSLLEAFLAEAAQRDLGEPGAVKPWARAVSAASGKKGRDLYHPLRVALTGRDQGPDLDHLVPAIEQGYRLGIVPRVPACRERLAARREALAGPSRSAR